jgi:predicted O-linked N-acetylglucosamine transferase (SPINDLY family)
MAAGHVDRAIDMFRGAIAAAPQMPVAYTNLGDALRMRGRFTEAIAACRRAIELRPGLLDAHLNLANALLSQGSFAEAVDAYRAALAINPNVVETHVNLGVALRGVVKIDEAIASFRTAISLNPKLATAWINLATALKDKGDLDAAIDAFREGIRCDPKIPQAHNNLGNVLRDQGRIADAIAAYRDALRLQGDFQTAHSNLLYATHFLGDYDGSRILADHRAWASAFAEPLTRAASPRDNDRSPDRKLRIGYVSPDLQDHVVGRFLLPLLDAHDRAQFEVHCFTNVTRGDHVTDRLRARAEHWHVTAGRSDADVASLVRQHRIDILVDLSLHSAGNRLLVFARKPAPVQVSYLGYPGTTGMSAIDYRLTDVYLDPPDRNDEFYAERSWRLPRTYWCYQPPTSAYALQPPPSRNNGRITFGCLNHFGRVVPALATWAEVLRLVSDSRLILHAAHGSHRNAALQIFRDREVDPTRIEFVPRQSIADYFATYNRIDVALDPFSYNGGTTTCDALWMGVPVVTMAGDIAVRRSGVSILSNVGLPEFIAPDRDAYIRLARELANDADRLTTLRSSLRDRMLASPLMDKNTFAADVESAYRAMWRQWCERAISLSTG